MKNKLILSTITTAFSVSVAYAQDVTPVTTQPEPVQQSASPQLTQEQINNLLSVQSQVNQLKVHVNKLEDQVAAQNRKIVVQNKEIAQQDTTVAGVKKDNNNLGERIFGIRNAGLGVGKHFGLDSAEDGSEVLITAPQLNKDYNLLLQNQYLDDTIGTVSEEGMRVQLSGTVQASFEADSNPFGQIVDDTGQAIPEEKSDLFGQAEFDIAAEINDWWTGYMHIFSSTQPETSAEMEQAFIILGDLDQLPTYASAGLMFLSNGSYYTQMVSRPLTREIGRSRDNAAVLGTVWEGFRGSIYGYDSERQLEGKSTDSLDQWGGSLDYTKQINDDVKFKAGIGYVNDISSAEAYAVGDVFDLDEEIDKYIPSGNINARLNVDDFSFFAEYQDNFRAFKEDEISFNSEGAKISAGNFEITYNFDWGRKSWITGNYGFTEEAVALLLPKNVYGVTYGVNVLKNTVLSFEYLIQKDYSEDDNGKAGVNRTRFGQSETNNQFTAQVDIFF